MRKTSEVLQEAINILSAMGWVQHDVAQDKDGNAINPMKPSVVAVCIYGALHRSRRNYSELDSACRAIRHVLPCEINEFNDSPGRTKEEVLDALIRARDIAKEEEEKGEEK